MRPEGYLPDVCQAGTILARSRPTQTMEYLVPKWGKNAHSRRLFGDTVNSSTNSLHKPLEQLHLLEAP